MVKTEAGIFTIILRMYLDETVLACIGRRYQFLSICILRLVTGDLQDLIMVNTLASRYELDQTLAYN